MNSRTVSAAFDSTASSFDRHREFPEDVLGAIRAVVLASVLPCSCPAILDLGAGTGRIGRAFVESGDAYVGLDISLGMLRHFRARGSPIPSLVQADGRRLPFREAAFDIVLLAQVLSSIPDWLPLLTEVRRILRKHGRVILGKLTVDPSGNEAKLKASLAQAIAESSADSGSRATNFVEPLDWLRCHAASSAQIVAARWTEMRTPRQFLERKPTGHRFASLDPSIQKATLAATASWANSVFGSLDVAVPESRSFDLEILTFEEN